MMVHGDDFTFCGVDEDLKWIKDLMEEWYDVKFRGILGAGKDEVKEITILNRVLKVTERGIEYEVDPKHRRAILEYFDFDGTTRVLSHNGDTEKREVDDEAEKLGKEESTICRGLAARMKEGRVPFFVLA